MLQKHSRINSRRYACSLNFGRSSKDVVFTKVNGRVIDSLVAHRRVDEEPLRDARKKSRPIFSATERIDNHRTTHKAPAGLGGAFAPTMLHSLFDYNDTYFRKNRRIGAIILPRFCGRGKCRLSTGKERFYRGGDRLQVQSGLCTPPVSRGEGPSDLRAFSTALAAAKLMKLIGENSHAITLPRNCAAFRQASGGTFALERRRIRERGRGTEFLRRGSSARRA